MKITKASAELQGYIEHQFFPEGLVGDGKVVWSHDTSKVWWSRFFSWVIASPVYFFLAVGIAARLSGSSPLDGGDYLIGVIALGVFFITFKIQEWIRNLQTRPEKTSNDYVVKDVKDFASVKIAQKEVTGSLLGAAAGGLLFGGFGAVVGAIAGGNEVNDHESIGIEFEDGNWIVCSKEGSSFVYTQLVKKFPQAKPF